jgi:hypothetical protein
MDGRTATEKMCVIVIYAKPANLRMKRKPCPAETVCFISMLTTITYHDLRLLLWCKLPINAV